MSQNKIYYFIFLHGHIKNENIITLEKNQYLLLPACCGNMNTAERSKFNYKKDFVDYLNNLNYSDNWNKFDNDRTLYNGDKPYLLYKPFNDYCDITLSLPIPFDFDAIFKINDFKNIDFSRHVINTNFSKKGFELFENIYTGINYISYENFQYNLLCKDTFKNIYSHLTFINKTFPVNDYVYLFKILIFEKIYGLYLNIINDIINISIEKLSQTYSIDTKYFIFFLDKNNEIVWNKRNQIYTDINYDIDLFKKLYENISENKEKLIIYKKFINSLLIDGHENNIFNKVNNYNNIKNIINDSLDTIQSKEKTEKILSSNFNVFILNNSFSKEDNFEINDYFNLVVKNNMDVYINKHKVKIPLEKDIIKLYINLLCHYSIINRLSSLSDLEYYIYENIEIDEDYSISLSNLLPLVSKINPNNDIVFINESCQSFEDDIKVCRTLECHSHTLINEYYKELLKKIKPEHLNYEEIYNNILNIAELYPSLLENNILEKDTIIQTKNSSLEMRKKQKLILNFVINYIKYNDITSELKPLIASIIHLHNINLLIDDFTIVYVTAIIIINELKHSESYEENTQTDIYDKLYDELYGKTYIKNIEK